jgi:hypothetical protein
MTPHVRARLGKLERRMAKRYTVTLATQSYCTLAVTVAFAFGVNEHVRRFSPPLEQAPDQIASRPLDTLSVIVVPALNDADPVVPTLTLIPEGLDTTRSPLRPVADTVRSSA